FKEFKEFPEKIIKDKDKDIFETGGPVFGGDPALQLTQLEGRLALLEGQPAAGQAFIRAEERPEVGARALAEPGAPGGGALIEHHPDADARPMAPDAEPGAPGGGALIE